VGKVLLKGWNYLLALAQGIVAARKWLLAYVVLILVPASVMLYSYYQKSSQILEEEVTRTMQQTLKQAGINLNDRINHVRDISNSIFMNQNLYEYLNGSNEIGEQLNQMANLRNLVESVQTNSNILRVRLFIDPSKLYSGDNINFFPLDSLKNRPWYKPIMDAGGSIVWTGDYKETYLDEGDQNILSCARVLRLPTNFEQIVGILMIDISDKMISDVMSGLDFSDNHSPFILDRDGKIIYSANRSLIGKASPLAGQLEGSGKPEEGIFKQTEGKEDLYVVYTTIHSTGWKLVSEVPKTRISSRAVALNQSSSIAVLIGITVMFLILVFVLITFTVLGMNRRVQTVLRMIRKEGIERLEDRRSYGDGDFRLLERSVDHLIRRVKVLMEETYQVKVQEREAQLRALQAQINPHFLYNALDTINWIAIGRNATDISQMIDALARYFRLSLNKGRDNVSVMDELNLAKVYLEIQQNRFPSSFTFSIGCEPESEQFIIPKLTLQPIVENALLHGIRKSKGKTGAIKIEARLEAENLLISVSDDGIGMEEDLAGRLLTVPRPAVRTDGSGSSYGLYNVNERIKLFAGNSYGLEIRSRPGEGTTVTVRLKAILPDHTQ
jgi:two-component system sensor histidine kinase YesM